MSGTQKFIIAILTLLVVCVFGALAGLVALRITPGGVAFAVPTSAQTVIASPQGVTATASPPTPTPAPTRPTCSAAAYANSVNPTIRKFLDDTELAYSTPRFNLSAVIASLQQDRREFEVIAVPSCKETLHTHITEAMDASINAFLSFLANGDTDQTAAAFGHTANLWKGVESELAGPENSPNTSPD